MHCCTLRLARPADLPGLAAIELAAAAIFPPGFLPRQVLSETVPAGVLEDACREGNLWVAEARTAEIAGYALLLLDGDLALLAQMDVHPAQARKGIGASLAGQAAARARELGYRFLYLTTFRDIPWNAPYYKRLDFEPVCGPQCPDQIRRILDQEAQNGLRNRTAMRLVL